MSKTTIKHLSGLAIYIITFLILMLIEASIIMYVAASLIAYLIVRKLYKRESEVY